MALKTMSMNAVDKQFIDDNMLTDEDFRFDAEEEIEITLEDQNIFESYSNGFQRMNDNLLTISNGQPVIGEMAVCPDLNDILQEMYDGLKVEPPSPNSSDVSSEFYSTDNEVSVITIPEVGSDNEDISVLNDTPPHTPCAAMDILPDSPGSCSMNPRIVSVASLTGITYALPQNTQATVKPVKYRVNIQPKVEPNTKVTKPVSMQTIIPKASNKSILTPQQMEKLARGTLQLRSPLNVAIPIRNGMQNAKTSNSLISKTSKNGATKKNSTLTSLEICAAALKRQERIIKNRESAYLSRKRKKEYVQKLEAELNQITAENSSLRAENFHLKLKVSDLEKEILKLKSVLSSKTIQKSVGLMVVLFMLTFNLVPLSSYFEKTTLKPAKQDVMNHRIGRVLLWNDGNSTEENNGSKLISRRRMHVPDEIKSSYIVNFDKTYNSSSCQHFINKTESLRLESDLLGWVERVEKKRKQRKMKTRKFHIENTLPHIASLSRRRAEINKDIWARKKNKNEILIYETPRQAYEDFFDAIHRRDDTFYFVSFSGDHLLLPAIAHNKTLRPRMSFVMPAMTLNESVGDSDEHISMMQIDCEVMDTKLVYIKESVIPEHLRQKQNNTTKPDSRHPEYSNDRPTRRIQSVNRLPQRSRTNG